ncbi:MAG: conjugal transfer protein TraI [Sphingomonadales bacterium 32-68-7]|nr:MAG: conjugal transfer protein TraI [Sphingomonadales bacterium 12-68-11]OYX10417.1 MAG: conjugal transfer protein TraI [Sphingomonadales bacterium 32-68-7]
MSEKEFEPEIGKMRTVRSPRGRKYLHAVLAAAMRAGLKGEGTGRRFGGSRLGRGAAAGRLLGSRDRHAGFRARRAVVKARIARLGGKGFAAARAHLRYIQRDGVGVEGVHGRLYAARDDAADDKAFLDRCEGDRHQFRFIVSAEDGADYSDLRPLVRRLMARMEQDLGTSLDWVAADHADTLHPHSHVILRGKDERGENLVIAPEYIARGMRERLAELVTLDLGPRSDREIEARLRLDVEAERLTRLDRRLVRDVDANRELEAGGSSSFDQALRAGRLRKLEALGLAESLGGGRWRLAPDLEATLRALGERGDIVRTMQRALGELRSDRALSEQVVFDPAAGQTITGRILARGLGDEIRDRHFLLIDGLDGRVHYVDIGRADAVETLPTGAIVEVEARAAASRASDRTIAAVARAHRGRYSHALHEAHDPSASDAFIAAHARRLEALRRPLGLERSAEGIWQIGGDYLARAEAFDARAARERPVAVRLLSALPLEQLAEHEGATWLDRELDAGAAVPARDAGFGREVRTALAVRRAWLLREGLMAESGEPASLRRGALAILQRRELLRVSEALARATGKDFVQPVEGTRLEGIVRQRLDLASGRFALIEGQREFALVPWRPVLERALGKPVSGIVREAGTSWTMGRDRGLGR